MLAGLEAAFVDIGLEKNGFLHVDEIVLPGVETPKRGRGSGGKDGQKIHDLLRPGQEITVQVVKDPLKTKGARLSMELAIPGRYMVYSPQGEGVGVSRRLPDKERDRLRKEAARLDLQGRRGDHPHGRLRRQTRGLRARAAVPLQAARGARQARRGDAGARPRLPGGGPVGARRARRLLRALRARDRRRRAAAPAARSRSSRAPRRSWSTASSCGRRTTSLFERYEVERDSKGRSRAASTCRAAAT